MSVAQCTKYAVPIFVFAMTASIASAVQSQEFMPSTEFKNGLIVGQATEAVWSTDICFTLMANWDGDDERLVDIETLVVILFRSAEVIHRAVKLPDHALPKKMRASFEKSLTLISDQLQKTTPERMDASKYHAGRKATIEQFRKDIKDEKMRKILIEIYDRQTETVKMLLKYGSSPQGSGKTKANGGKHIE